MWGQSPQVHFAVSTENQNGVEAGSLPAGRIRRALL